MGDAVANGLDLLWITSNPLETFLNSGGVAGCCTMRFQFFRKSRPILGLL